MYKKKYTYIVVCIEHHQSTPCICKVQCLVRLFMLPTATSNDTHWLSDKLRWHRLPSILGVSKAPQDESHVCDQSHHNDQPLCQRLALVGKKSSSDVMFSLHNWCLNVQRTSGTSLVQPLICNVLVTQEQMPNMPPNAMMNIVRPLNASKRQCHMTIMMTVIATIIVTCQHMRNLMPQCN